MSEFVEVAKADEIPPGTATVVEVGGVEVALVNSDGRFFAIGNECPHAGGSLGEGDLVDEHALECPLHGSLFDIRTGDVLGPPAEEPVQAYAVKVENGVVKIALD